MFGIRTRTLAAALVALIAGPHALHAQWGTRSDCSCYTPQQYVAAPAAVVTTSCQCLQPVTQMVQREMQVTAYRPKQYTEKVPVQRIKYRNESYTAYRQEMQSRTVEVPAMTYQAVTEVRPQISSNARWQTVVRPVQKMAACQYDSRPGFTGAMNRMGYNMRTAFQPNQTVHRQLVPQVCQCNTQTTRQVAVPTTRQVVINEAKMVPYETTRQVAYYETEMVEQTVTRMEAYTTTKTVSVPTTQYAYIDPFTGAAIAPEATRSAKEPTPATRSSENDKLPAGLKGSSIQKKTAVPATAAVEPTPATTVRNVTRVAKAKPKPTTVASNDDGWQVHTPTAKDAPAMRTLAPQGKTQVASNK